MKYRLDKSSHSVFSLQYRLIMVIKYRRKALVDEAMMPLWMRTMKCDCGNVIDRDKNSSVNIMLRFLSQNALCTGYQQFVDNLRKTGLPTPLEVHSQEALAFRLG